MSSLIEEAKEIDHEIVNLKKKLGKILSEIHEKSQEESIRFEDILSHDLNISKNTAEKCLRSKNIEENFSQDEMETVLKVKDSQTQQNIIDGLKKGKTLTAKEKAYIQKHKKEYIALFIQRAEANYENAEKSESKDDTTKAPRRGAFAMI